jgi:hypothetical protein
MAAVFLVKPAATQPIPSRPGICGELAMIRLIAAGCQRHQI